MSGRRRGAARSTTPPLTRKERSLGTLCEKFLQEYGGLPIGSPIGLDEAGLMLGVERRRLYDITNVMEAVECLVRSHKSKYEWLGFGNMGAALARLRDLPAPLQAYGYDLADRRERSLMHTAERFVQLFLMAPPPAILSLEQAAHSLIGSPDPSVAEVRTKVRRLYDIANVLASLGLLERAVTPDTLKPAYRWLRAPDPASAARGPAPAPLLARAVGGASDAAHLSRAAAADRVRAARALVSPQRACPVAAARARGPLRFETFDSGSDSEESDVETELDHSLSGGADRAEAREEGEGNEEAAGHDDGVSSLLHLACSQPRGQDLRPGLVTMQRGGSPLRSAAGDPGVPLGAWGSGRRTAGSGGGGVVAPRALGLRCPALCRRGDCRRQQETPLPQEPLRTPT
ncbi:hypothetical protein WJX81_001879 [Elliptochloris bilobata]|uniref:E2F/DP family winged-helix DNA-binding domain-containing protein n=1 Tax=Elliptochloris bilobata TaxID=381761 RepID=A0AAW1SAL4_9CHLO